MSNKLSEKARAVIERARYENDNLNVVIVALVGAIVAKTGETPLDISAEEITLEPNDLFGSKLRTIEYNEDGTLFYTDDDDEEDGNLDHLPMSTRLELAEKLSDLFES